MSGSPRKSGPARRPSPAVYRRRRLLALLLLLAVLAAIVWGVSAIAGRFGGEQTAQQRDEAESPDPQVSSAPAEPRDCRAADVDLAVAVDPPAPTAGQAVAFDLTLVSSATQPCLLDAGPAAITATVTSGGDTVWASAHCAEDTQDRLLLDTGTEHRTTVRWPGTRSTADCAPDQPAAGTGTYRVTVALDGTERTETFTLAPGPEDSSDGEPTDGDGDGDGEAGEPADVPAD